MEKGYLVNILKNRKYRTSSLLFILFLISFIRVSALSSPYAPGSTLDPECSPGEENCSVSLFGNSSYGQLLYKNSYGVVSGISNVLPDPAGRLQIGGIEVTDWPGFSPAKPSNGQVTINYGASSGYSNEGRTHSYRIYSYKLEAGRRRVYSQKYTQVSVTDNNQVNDLYTISFSWDATPNVSGYRIVKLLDSSVATEGYAGMYFDAGYDTNDTSVVDDNCLLVCFTSDKADISSYHSSNEASAFIQGDSIFDGTLYVSGLPISGHNSSTFSVGYNAGVNLDGIFAHNSNFIGTNAGYDAPSANYSNLFGYQAGKGFTNNHIGANNIIIGTNITLPDAATNALNIGGVIFATGTHSDATGNPSFSPESLGRVGIGTNAPTAILHLGTGGTDAGSAPIKLTSGGLLNAPEDGAIEYSANHLYFTSGTTRYQLDQQSANVDLSNYARFSDLSNYARFSDLSNYARFSDLSSYIQNTGSPYSSLFIGNNAGSNTTATSSNFLGVNAGFGAANAGSSIFIGNNAGYNDTVNNQPSTYNTVISSITVGSYPHPSAVIGNKLYVKNSSAYVSIINTNTNTIMGSINFNSGINSLLIVGTKLYVSSSSALYIVDTDTDTILTSVEVDYGASSMVSVGSKLFLEHSGTNYVTAFNTTNNTFSHILVNSQNAVYPVGMTLVGSNLYMSDTFMNANKIRVVNTVNNSVSSITVGTSPASVVASGSKVYVSNLGSDTVSVVNTNTNTVIKTISVGSAPYRSIVVGNKLYVGNVASHDVSVIDTTTDTVIKTISSMGNIQNFTLVGTKLYVNNAVSSSMNVIDTNTDNLISTISVGNPQEDSFLVGTKLYTGSSNSNVVHVIDVDSSISPFSVLLGSYTNTGGFSGSILLGSGFSGSPISNTKANQFMLAPTITEARFRGIDYTFPATQAAGAGYVLSNDGNGVLSWVPNTNSGGNSGNSTFTGLSLQNTNISPSLQNIVDPSLGVLPIQVSSNLASITNLNVTTTLNLTNTSNTQYPFYLSDSGFDGLMKYDTSVHRLTIEKPSSAGGYSTGYNLRLYANDDSDAGGIMIYNRNSGGSAGAGIKWVNDLQQDLLQIYVCNSNCAYSPNTIMYNNYGTGVMRFNTTQNKEIQFGTDIYGTSNFIVFNQTANRLLVKGIGATSSTWTAQFHNSTGTSNTLMIRDDGRVAIGNNAPAYTLHVGSSSISGIVAGFTNSSSTCTINPASTSLSCSSDINLKKNITLIKDETPFILNTSIVPSTTTLQKVLSLTPVIYNWNTELDTDTKHAGFIAQEVEQIFPALVSTDEYTHMKSVNYIGFIPYSIEAIKEMDIKLSGITTLDITNPLSVGSLIRTFLSDVNNQIGDVYAKVVHSDDVQTKDIHANDKICIGNTCVTESQLIELLSKNSNNSNNASGNVNDSNSSNTPINSNTSNPDPLSTLPVADSNPAVLPITPADSNTQ
jgi:YVTN family beta-propeller protein